MPKRIKMTRRKRKEQLETVEGWLEHKANIRRKKKEEDRKRAAEKMNREFEAYRESCCGCGSTDSVCHCNANF